MSCLIGALLFACLFDAGIATIAHAATPAPMLGAMDARIEVNLHRTL